MTALADARVSAYVDVPTVRKMFRALPIDTPRVGAAVMVAIVEPGELALVARNCDRVTFAGSTSLAPSDCEGAGVASVMVSYDGLKASLAAIGRRKCVEVSIVDDVLIVDDVTLAPLHESNVSAQAIRGAFDWLTRPAQASAHFHAADVLHTIRAAGEWYESVLATAHVSISGDPLAMPMDKRRGAFAEMACTDRYRIHTARAYMSHGSTDGDRTFNLPVSAIKATMPGKSVSPMRVEYLQPQGLSGDYRARLSCTLLDRKGVSLATITTASVTSTREFPRYEGLFPTEAYPNGLYVSADELSDAVAAVARYVKVGKLANRPVILDVDERGVSVSVNAADGDERALAFAPIRIAGTTIGAPLRIAFNPDYLLDVLAGYVGNGSVTIAMHVEASKPAVVRLAYGWDETRALLMPVKL